MRRLTGLFYVLGLALLPASIRAVEIPMVPVANPGNAPDQLFPDDVHEHNPLKLQFGSVPYNYRIGMYEVTNDQYAEFLNAVISARGWLFVVAAMQPIPQYPEKIPDFGLQWGQSNSVVVKPNMGDKPATRVQPSNAARFVNWLQNGQGAGDTENGTYKVGSALPYFGPRNTDATWFLPSENEWYKSAYYDQSLNDGDGGYWLYPTRSNSYPTMATANSVGEISNPGANVANYNSNARWWSAGSTEPSLLTSVGSAGPLSQSYYGTSDQGGNALEITEDRYNYYVSPNAPIYRGGSAYSWKLLNDFDLHAAVRWRNPPGTTLGGFRVAATLLDGDANADGKVTGADYTLWAASFGKAGDWKHGDFNSDGKVTGADYTLWAANFKSGGSAVMPIPEPSGSILLMSGALSLAVYVLRQTRRAILRDHRC